MAFSCFLSYGESSGYTADSLRIYVGYQGGPYYLKKEFSLQEMNALPLHKVTYSSIDNMPSVVEDYACGVYFPDLMDAAGIDLGSVQMFHFCVGDKSEDNGKYSSWQKSDLVDMNRYFYPRLYNHFDYTKGQIETGAEVGARQVQPMIAVWDHWVRLNKDDTPYRDYDVHDTSVRFRLIFGQSAVNDQGAVPSERTSSKSAKWIHSIYVQLAGTPPSFSVTKKNLLNQKTGSVIKPISLTMPDDSPDAAWIMEHMIKNVQWSSSNEDVARVDSDGNVRILKKGSARISVKISYTDESGRQKTMSESAAVSGSGDGDKPNEDKNKGSKQDEKKSKDPSGGSSGRRIYEMSTDADKLGKVENKGAMVQVAAVMISALAAGAVVHILRYRRQMRP
ncbi:MAG: Ig-like domain-containing protein [Anaerovoracaceae bacterium]